MAGEKEIWQKIGEGFVQEYYNQFDNTNRMGLGNLYSAEACLTWEGSPFQGREAIAGKLASLPFKRIKHIITEQDFQPTIDSCILIMVFGQLQILSVHATFVLQLICVHTGHRNNAKRSKKHVGPEGGDKVYISDKSNARKEHAQACLVDDELPMAFHQVFMLKSQNCAWACTNDVFRLGIHNIPV